VAFSVFDALGDRGKPDLAQYGIKPLRLLKAGSLWPTAERAEPDAKHVRQFVSAQGPAPEYACINIEHWPLNDALTVSANMARYRAVLDAASSIWATTKLGIYGMLPVREYHPIIRKDQAALAAWRAKNDALHPLAVRVDVIYPSLYTFYPDRDGWVAYAIANLTEARKYNAPVHVFLWPQYHASGNEPIPADYWRLQLETARKYADGVVLWSPKGVGNVAWDSAAPWWLETRAFLARTQLKGPE